MMAEISSTKKTLKIEHRDFVSKTALAKVQAKQTDDELWAELGGLFEALDNAGTEFWEGVEERADALTGELNAFFKEHKDIIQEVKDLTHEAKDELRDLIHIVKVT